MLQYFKISIANDPKILLISIYWLREMSVRKTKWKMKSREKKRKVPERRVIREKNPTVRA